MRKKTENYDRWISGMAKIQAKMRRVTGSENVARWSAAKSGGYPRMD
jgi:hypothetical protein